MADVFVSYSRSDRARVAPLVAAIEAQGWSVWWDPHIAPGQAFDDLIDAELRAASAVLVVWTPQSVASRWVRGEAREGAERGILVPVRFDAAILPIDLRALHAIDFDGASAASRQSQLQQMLQALGSLVAGPTCKQAPARVQVSTVQVSTAPAETADRIAICVLPFANLGGDVEQTYFSDGITEDIITELSRWRMLAVRSRSTSFQYRDVAVDLRQLARELDVRFIVEGSVRRIGGRVRINARLVDTGTGNDLWAEKFDRELAGIFEVQDQLVRTIVSTLVGRIQVSDLERLRRKPPANLAAYECVLRGNALSWDDPDQGAEAGRMFEQAIALDPGYGFAHALLAAVRYGQWREGAGESDALLQDAYVLAKRGVELDPSESTCFSMLAQVCLLRRQFDMAVQYVQRAVELNPTNQWNAADMGYVLLFVGEAENALACFARARQIDPYFDPPWYFRSIGQAHMVQHRFREALAMFEQASIRTHRVDAYMAACRARLGDTAGAAASVSACLARQPGFSIRRFMLKEPFKDPAAAAHLAESLRMAGLPG